MLLREESRSYKTHNVSISLGTWILSWTEHIPAIITLHASQASEMSQHSTNHPGYARHTLQEDEAGQPLLLRHLKLLRYLLPRLWMFVPRHQVHAPSEEANGAQGNPVGPIGGFAVCDSHALHLRIGVAVVLGISSYSTLACGVSLLTSDATMPRPHLSLRGFLEVGRIP